MSSRSTNFPGRSCPGLIEARTGRARGSTARGFPGRSCPGLIEAATTRRRRRRFSATFPGRSCPGLIEALARAVKRIGETTFRGDHAPASLKHADGRVQRLHRLPFRGDHAPASLKRGLSAGASTEGRLSVSVATENCALVATENVAHQASLGRRQQRWNPPPGLGCRPPAAPPRAGQDPGGSNARVFAAARSRERS